ATGGCATQKAVVFFKRSQIVS
ncbi:beta-hexosaminidase, partial [Vibrio parahaemolyticus VP2007-007]